MLLPSFAASRNEDVEPSALPTILSAEKDEPELAEFLALIILSPLSFLSIHPITTLLPCEEIATESTEFVELKVSEVPNVEPPSVDFVNSVT